MPENTRPAERATAHPCPACGSHLVDLIDGIEVASGMWDVTLRCPECEQQHAVSCSEEDLARLEHELCTAAAELERELERFARVRFEEDVARFVTAIEAGAILPMDFGSPR
jgi:predicted RNA-binding Zn-ribbon protein involved in translation (DUF1610 family)